MASWLSRATSLFQPPPPPPADPFEVECDCGGRIVGLRTVAYQKRPCPRCQNPVFVLPANVYPRPKPKPSVTPVLPKTTSEVHVQPSDEKVVVDDTRPMTGSKSTKLERSDFDRKLVASPAKEPELLSSPRARVFTPVRLLGLAIFLMTAVTAAGLWRRHQIETAKAIVARATDDGKEALRTRDFVKASEELQRAHAAVDVLGRKDETANEIRRISRQATAAAKLASSTLTEILEEALTAAKADTTKSPQLTSVDRSAWIVFDARIVPSDDVTTGYFVDGPIQFADSQVRIEIVTGIFRQQPRADESGEAPRAIFAAQLEQLTAPTGDPPTAVLTLNGKTAFLWSSYDIYSAIGYRPNDTDPESERETRALLDRQTGEKP